MSDEPYPEAPIGFVINQLRLALRIAYEEALGPLQVTVPQIGVLAGVARSPGASVAQLAQEKAVTPQSMAQHVAALEAAGLLTRMHVTGRGHVLELHLTPAGNAALRRGRAAMCAVEARLWAGIDTAERARFRELLERHLAPLRSTRR